jgi:hypothetical protein
MPSVSYNQTLIDGRNASIQISIGGIQSRPPVVNVQPNAGPDSISIRLAAPTQEQPRRPPTTTLRGRLYELAVHQRLLCQTDDRLAQHGLLRPDGGLCATTSAINAIHGAFSALGLDTSHFQQSDDLVLRLVQRSYADLNVDARMGLRFSQLSSVVNSVANTLHAGVGVFAEAPMMWRSGAGIDFKRLLGDESTLALLAVTTGPNSSHAVALLDIDERHQVITYSDPNYPHAPQARRFRQDGRGGLWIDGFDNGQLVDVLHIKTNHLRPQRSRTYEDVVGHRVLITTNEGRQYRTAAADIERPTPQFPSGRLIAYNMFWGSGGGGTTDLREVRHIEVCTTPSNAELKRYRGMVGKNIAIKLNDSYNQRQIDESASWKLLDVVPATGDGDAPDGGLHVESISSDGVARGGLIPFDLIESATLIDARLAARGSGRASKPKSDGQRSGRTGRHHSAGAARRGSPSQDGSLRSHQAI